MANLTTQQLAELLLGVARAQHAVIEALENSKAGFKATHFRPTLESVSRIRSNHPDSLVDFPARLLLQMLGRTGPDAAQVARSLEALLSAAAAPAAAPAVASATAPAALVAPAANAPDSLDMT